MTKEALAEILKKHRLWLNCEKGGKRARLQDADLRDADLRGAYLRGADLQGAYLQGADLQDAYLQDADLRGAYLRGADLQGAYLQDADLQGAYLQDADLRGAYLQDAYLRGAYLQGADLQDADLQGADLRGAYLQGADLRGARNVPDLPETSIVPECGSFIGWKKVNTMIIKLEILADAKRSNAAGRKCRCSAAKVLEIQNLDGSPSGVDSVVNKKYAPVTYKVGENVLPDSFDDNRWNECSHGIHFFITRQEAVDYSAF